MTRPHDPVPRTLYERVWHQHLVSTNDDTGQGEGPSILAIDLHLLHEVTSPQAFATLEERGLPVRRPGQCVATMDHSTPTALDALGRRLAARGRRAAQLETLAHNCRDAGIPLFPIGDPRQGIVHVVGPELGLTQPGATIVCGDSHTSTHGAFGALAFGIGTSEVAQVLATQCLLMRKARTFEVTLDGQLRDGVTAKDVILALIATIGVDGGTGHVFEYTGSAVRAMDMEARMTLCNMSIEAGARAGMIAPDDTTYAYLADRPYAPRGDDWDRAVEHWRTLPTDPGAKFDRRLRLSVDTLTPRITFGTDPGMGIGIRDPVPNPDTGATSADRDQLARALRYMDLLAGEPLLGRPIDVVFVGSCTNGRLSDLRQAASVLRDHKVASGVRMVVVPGSDQVKRQAEAEGLADLFRRAGAEWHGAGCSLCLAMNGDHIAPGQLAVSTSNRNFEGRQGPGGRTLLASPLTAAACAATGTIADVRELM